MGKNFLTDLRFIFSSIFKSHIKKSLYIGYTGYGNLGDEALKEAIFELFDKNIFFSESRGLLIRCFEKINFLHFNILFLGGGTLILRSEYVLSKIKDRQIQHKIIFGTGVANPEFWKTIPGKYGSPDDWIETLNKCSYISVRGPISKKILQDAGYKKDIRVIGDPVLYFTREIKGHKAKKKRLGLNIGTAKSKNDGDLLWGRDESKFHAAFIKFLHLMLNDGWEIEFIPVSQSDHTVIEKLLLNHQLRHKIKIFTHYNSTQMTIDRLEYFDVFIGEKLHATILATCANTPSAMIEYRPKCRDFMASIDMLKFNMRTDTFNPNDAKILVEELYGNIENFRQKTNIICLDYKNKLIQASKEISDLLCQI